LLEQPQEETKNEEEDEETYVQIIIEQCDRPVIPVTSLKLLRERSDEAQLVNGWREIYVRSYGRKHDPQDEKKLRAPSNLESLETLEFL